ncbi:hypothetical protein MNB_SV-12-32 [hydrothermal vent metagenome]|uniref:Uncharacterized protein n=1 Tax=hydrothermal vent metagenome TaxID=652676 RepID=A0A1W1BGP4_9ZZZZ
MNLKLKKVEKLILEYLKARPFHNLFMLHDIQITGSKIGGTCSEMTIEFKEILLKNGFDAKLHCSLVDGVENKKGDKK